MTPFRMKRRRPGYTYDKAADIFIVYAAGRHEADSTVLCRLTGKGARLEARRLVEELTKTWKRFHANPKLMAVS